MARMRADGTVLLNAVQFATYNELLTFVNDKGFIPAEIVGSYKQNVIKGIVKYGVLEWFRETNLRQPKKAVAVIEMPESTPRGSVEEDEQVAA